MSTWAERVQAHVPIGQLWQIVTANTSFLLKPTPLL